MEEKKQEFVPADEAVRQYEALVEGIDPSVFNADQTAALLTMRMKYENDPQVIRQERRLKFARWLAENGRISEGEGSLLTLDEIGDATTERWNQWDAATQQSESDQLASMPETPQDTEADLRASREAEFQQWLVDNGRL